MFLILPQLLPVDADLLQFGMLELQRPADQHTHLIPISVQQILGKLTAYQTRSTQHYSNSCH
ncbi:hypothetical protein D3C81_2186000 [compost metagenome]